MTQNARLIRGAGSVAHNSHLGSIIRNRIDFFMQRMNDAQPSYHASDCIGDRLFLSCHNGVNASCRRQAEQTIDRSFLGVGVCA